MKERALADFRRDILSVAERAGRWKRFQVLEEADIRRIWRDVSKLLLTWSGALVEGRENMSDSKLSASVNIQERLARICRAIEIIAPAASTPTIEVSAIVENARAILFALSEINAFLGSNV